MTIIPVIPRLLALSYAATLGYSAMSIHSLVNRISLFDFTSPASFNVADVALWTEVSDTVRTPGKSKAVFSLQQTQMFQRAVMFAMINPQPNGAGFAGVSTKMPAVQAEGAKGLELKVRGQGQFKHWKVVLKDNVQPFDYEHKFALQKMDECEFEDVRLPFSSFEAYKRGKKIDDAPILDLNKVTSIGVQTFGGVYDDFKQNGTGSLELDSISVYI